MGIDSVMIAFAGLIIGIGIAYFEYIWSQKKGILQAMPFVRTAVVSSTLAAVFMLMVHHFGWGWQALGFMGLCAVLIAVILTDLDTGTIPNALIIAGITSWLLSLCLGFLGVGFEPIGSVFSGPWTSALLEGVAPLLLNGLVAGFLVAGFLLLTTVIYEQVRGRFALGGGDIKLIFVISLYLGVMGSIVTLLLACVFGLIFAPLWRGFLKRQHSKGLGVSKGSLKQQERSGVRITQNTQLPDKTLPVRDHVEGVGNASAAPEKTILVGGDADKDEDASQVPNAGVRTFPFGPSIALAAMIVIAAAPLAL